MNGGMLPNRLASPFKTLKAGKIWGLDHDKLIGKEAVSILEKDFSKKNGLTTDWELSLRGFIAPDR